MINAQRELLSQHGSRLAGRYLDLEILRLFRSSNLPRFAQLEKILINGSDVNNDVRLFLLPILIDKFIYRCGATLYDVKLYHVFTSLRHISQLIFSLYKCWRHRLECDVNDLFLSLTSQKKISRRHYRQRVVTIAIVLCALWLAVHFDKFCINRPQLSPFSQMSSSGPVQRPIKIKVRSGKLSCPLTVSYKGYTVLSVNPSYTPPNTPEAEMSDKIGISYFYHFRKDLTRPYGIAWESDYYEEEHIKKNVKTINCELLNRLMYGISEFSSTVELNYKYLDENDTMEFIPSFLNKIKSIVKPCQILNRQGEVTGKWMKLDFP